MTKQFTASEVREVVSHMDDVAMTDAEEILLAFASRLEADEKAEAVGDADDCVRGIRLKFQSGNDVPVERAWITRSEWDAVERLLATHPSPTQPPSDAGKPQIEFPPDPGHQVYQLMSITDERYRHEQWREVTYSEYVLGKDRPFTASRILYTVPQADDPADRAWRKWADDLRSAIGDREGWLTLTTHVRARGDSICFSRTTLVPPSD